MLALLLLITGTVLAFWRKKPVAHEPALLPTSREPMTRRLPSPNDFVEAPVDLPAPTLATPDTDRIHTGQFSSNQHRTYHSPQLPQPPHTESFSDNEPTEHHARVKMPIIHLGVRSHVVVDGDTLSNLAARYLNDRNRYQEIFAANRKILSNPDLLPIGAVLEIPAAKQQTIDISHATEPRQESQGEDLVPIPEGALNSSD
jgi:nucleoid-associated protein YgaU